MEITLFHLHCLRHMNKTQESQIVQFLIKGTNLFWLLGILGTYQKHKSVLAIFHFYLRIS